MYITKVTVLDVLGNQSRFSRYYSQLFEMDRKHTHIQGIYTIILPTSLSGGGGAKMICENVQK